MRHRDWVLSLSRIHMDVRLLVMSKMTNGPSRLAKARYVWERLLAVGGMVVGG